MAAIFRATKRGKLARKVSVIPRGRLLRIRQGCKVRILTTTLAFRKKKKRLRYIFLCGFLRIIGPAMGGSSHRTLFRVCAHSMPSHQIAVGALDGPTSVTGCHLESAHSGARGKATLIDRLVQTGRGSVAGSRNKGFFRSASHFLPRKAKNRHWAGEEQKRDPFLRRFPGPRGMAQFPIHALSQCRCKTSAQVQPSPGPRPEKKKRINLHVQAFSRARKTGWENPASGFAAFGGRQRRGRP